VAWQAGECLAVTGTALIDASEDSDLLFAYPGTSHI
jgi:mannose-6-phosphate isomerase